MEQKKLMEKIEEAKKKLDAPEDAEETEFEPTWDFTEDGREELVGVLKEIRTIIGAYGDSNRYIFNVIEDGEVKEYGLWGNTVIDNRFADLGIEEGDVVAIRYLGTRISKNKRKYQNYKIVKV